MANDRLILRSLISPWVTPIQDLTKSSVLTHDEVDNNFIYLRGELIYTAQTVGSTVTLKKINGNDLSFNVGSGGGSGYWTSGSTGFYSIKTVNDSGLDATANYSVASGFNTLASGTGSTAQGFDTTASGAYSHAEGAYTVASGLRSHAEGSGTDAIGNSSHAEGTSTIASGFASHAEGNTTTASGANSHAEGAATTASGQSSHAEGYLTVANGYGSHSGGYEYNNSGQHRVVSDGDSSFAHFRINQMIGDIGAYADQSTILGGLNHNIDSSSTNSAILGGSSNRIVGASGSIVLGGQNITGTTDDTVYTPKLNVGTGTPDSKLHVGGAYGDLKVRLDNENSNSTNQLFLTSDENAYTNFVSIGTPTSDAELQFGMIGPSSTSRVVGNPDDSFIAATSAADNMNFINNEGSGTSDNIGFYAGKVVLDHLSATTSDIMILGDGTNRGYVGIGTDTPTEKLDVVSNLKVRGQAYTPIHDNLTGGTTFIPDWDNSNVQILTLSGNTNVSGGTSTMKGGSAYTMLVKQSNGGSKIITWDSTYKWESGTAPTLSTADGSVDIITFICDGTYLYGLTAKNFQ